MFVFSSDYAGKLRLPHERPAALHPVSRFKSAKPNCVAIVNSLSPDSSPLSDSSPSSCALTKRPELTRNHVIEDLQTECPISGLCGHNGGVLTSKDGDLRLTIPKGAIKEGDLVTLSLASDLFGPFVLPSKCPADVVSPYYRIRVTGPYDFQKPVQVEFEHFGACDPSHYELLCCEDDDESYTMHPADGYTLKFTIQDDISLCSFYTDKFCSYCLFPGCTDPKINRIAALYLKTKDFQYLNHFTAEIWFSFPISLCLNRNKKLYTNQGMVLDRKNSYIFEAPCDKSSTTYFALSYHQDINGWDVRHSRSTEIDTKEINFYNYYTDKEELKASEENGLFPHRFIVNVTKKSDCNTDLDTAIMITLHNKKEILKSVSCNLFVQVIPNTTKDRTTSLTGIY